jgi:hypothetical protein
VNRFSFVQTSVGGGGHAKMALHHQQPTRGAENTEMMTIHSHFYLHSYSPERLVFIGIVEKYTNGRGDLYARYGNLAFAGMLLVITM